jgi:hypothetical protein
MWTAVSAKWSVGLRSLLRLTDWAVSFRVCAVLESAREQAGAARLITRFARQIARFSARLLSG